MLAPSEYDSANTRGYLDTASYGLPPRSSVEAFETALTSWREGKTWETWEEDGEACRRLFAHLIGGRSEDVALLPAVSAAAGLVAAGLDVSEGNNVVLFERDFTSTLLPWRGLAERGVELRLRPLEELAEAVDEKTALVAVSSVQSADGTVADLAALRAGGVRLFLDATQAVGAVPVDAQDADYIAAHPYKWLCTPRGLGFMHVRRERLPEIEPWTAGWKSRLRPYEDYYGLPELTPDARRLDVSLPWLAAAGARPSLELIAAIGVDRIAAHDLGLARRFAAEADLPEPESPIIRVAVSDPDEVVTRVRQAGLSCAVRAGSVRLSFHFYNDESDVDLALEALAPAVASDRRGDEGSA